MHCESSYPVPMEQANLRMISEMKTRYYNATIGYSDHTLGIDAAVISAALGARVIEKQYMRLCLSIKLHIKIFFNSFIFSQCASI